MVQSLSQDGFPPMSAQPLFIIRSVGGSRYNDTFGKCRYKEVGNHFLLILKHPNPLISNILIEECLILSPNSQAVWLGSGTPSRD